MFGNATVSRGAVASQKKAVSGGTRKTRHHLQKVETYSGLYIPRGGVAGGGPPCFPQVFLSFCLQHRKFFIVTILDFILEMSKHARNVLINANDN